MEDKIESSASEHEEEIRSQKPRKKGKEKIRTKIHEATTRLSEREEHEQRIKHTSKKHKESNIDNEDEMHQKEEVTSEKENVTVAPVQQKKKYKKKKTRRAAYTSSDDETSENNKQEEERNQLAPVIYRSSMAPEKNPLTESRSWLSVISKLFSTSSSAAGALYKAYSGIGSPILGFISQIFDQWFNRVDHNEKRDKIDKRIDIIKNLRDLLPEEQKSAFDIPRDILNKKGVGADPNSSTSRILFGLSVGMGAITTGSAIAADQLDGNDWQKTFIGFTAASIIIYSFLYNVEEHYKKATLDQHLNTLKEIKQHLSEQLGQNKTPATQTNKILYPTIKRGNNSA